MPNVAVPLVFSFWFTVAAYVVHVLDESLLGGSFVEKVRLHWWPEYSWTKFFWFNTGYFLVMIASVVGYDFFGGAWVILPLAWVIERACNGLWHVWWAIHFREYSPGLLSSLLMWMNLYFILRYRPAVPLLTIGAFVPALFIGLLWTAFLFFYIPLAKGRANQAKHARVAPP
jgi:Protein of unknown function with HXXEE motif